MSWLAWAFVAYAVLGLGSMATMSIGAGVVAIAIVASFIRDGGGTAALASLREEPSARRYLRLSAALALACVVSLLVAYAYPLGYGGKVLHVELFSQLPKLWYLFWSPILLLGLKRLAPAERTRVLQAWVGMLGFDILIGVIQFLTGWPRHQMIPGVRMFHATIFFGHHLSTASILIFPTFFALDRYRAGSLGSIRRPWLLAAALGGALVLVLSFSRMAWVALPIGLALWFVLSLPRKQAIGLVAGLVVVLFASTFHPFVSKRIHDQLGHSERYALWEANWEFFKARPLTGTGFRHNSDVAAQYISWRSGKTDVFTGHAHDNVLDVLGSTGLLGLVAWLAWCGFVILLAWRARSPGLVCAWVAFQVNGLTQVNFWEGKVQHQMMWAVALCLLWALPARRPQPELPEVPRA